MLHEANNTVPSRWSHGIIRARLLRYKHIEAFSSGQSCTDKPV